MQAHKTGILPIPGLTVQAQTATLFEKLRVPLISLGQICDDDFIITLHKNWIKIHRDEREIIKGTRNARDGMWEILI